jgi:hypothetical protein
MSPISLQPHALPAEALSVAKSTAFSSSSILNRKQLANAALESLQPKPVPFSAMCSARDKSCCSEQSPMNM